MIKYLSYRFRFHMIILFSLYIDSINILFHLSDKRFFYELKEIYLFDFLNIFSMIFLRINFFYYEKDKKLK